ncbi:hypothetical protein, partial [Reichenbachiella versicolor]|uniref:hypothetical protein n=1 Tax=Reichenbachiella versicolor TaxID=1821036 RepID=UPI0013A5A8CD
MVEARAARDGIKEDVEKAPKEAKALEQKEKSALDKSLQSEEKVAVDQMVRERQRQLTRANDSQKKGKGDQEKERKRVSDRINGFYTEANSQVQVKLKT